MWKYSSICNFFLKEISSDASLVTVINENSSKDKGNATFIMVSERQFTLSRFVHFYLLNRTRMKKLCKNDFHGTLMPLPKFDGWDLENLFQSPSGSCDVENMEGRILCNLFELNIIMHTLKNIEASIFLFCFIKDKPDMTASNNGWDGAGEYGNVNIRKICWHKTHKFREIELRHSILLLLRLLLEIKVSSATSDDASDWWKI